MLLLLVFICVIIVYHLFGYIGHYGYDDLHYAKLAVDFNEGIVDYNDHFSYRTPIIVLTSLAYSILGVNDLASSIPSMIITVLIIGIVYQLLKNKGSRTLIVGLSLTTFSNWFIFYSDKLMPDVYVALSVLLALYIIHQYKFHSNKKNTFLYSCMLSLALLFGFMSKGTIVLFIPVLLFFFIVDFLLKRDRKFWMFSIVSGAVIFLCYFLIIGHITGDAFKRFDAIVSNSYLNLCSYEKQPLAILLRRIFHEFFELLIYQSMITGFVFLIAYLIGKRSVSFLKMDSSFSFWIASSLMLLLSSNFMTISFTSYSPMCLDPRHYLFLIPVVSIPASIIVNEFIVRKSFKIEMLSVMVVTAFVSIFLQGNNFLYHYFPLFMLFFIYLWVKPIKIYQNLFVILFILVLMMKPVTMIEYAQKIKYRKQKEIFTEYIINQPDSCIVITNDVQKRLGNYYNKFNKDGRIKIMNYSEFEIDTLENRKKILFLNLYTRYLSKLDYEDLPYYVRNNSSSNRLIYQEEELKIEIYEMNEILIPEQSFQRILYTRNGFEEQMENWNLNNESFSSEIKYEGYNSNEVTEYSATFEYSLDSLDLDTLSRLAVSCTLHCYFEDQTNSKLIISIEDRNGAYVWHGLEVNKFIKAYSNWWPVTHEITVDVKEIKPGSRLKVYLWNMDKQKAFVDNFEISITGY